MPRVVWKSTGVPSGAGLFSESRTVAATSAVLTPSPSISVGARVTKMVAMSPPPPAMNSTVTCAIAVPTLAVTMACPGVMSLRRVAVAMPLDVAAWAGKISPAVLVKLTSVPSWAGLLLAFLTVAVSVTVLVPSAGACAAERARKIVLV